MNLTLFVFSYFRINLNALINYFTKNHLFFYKLHFFYRVRYYVIAYLTRLKRHKRFRIKRLILYSFSLSIITSDNIMK